MKTKYKFISCISTILLLGGCNQISQPSSSKQDISIPDPIHEHTFNSEWATNDYMHWHEASCIHSELTKDLGDHDYDENGFCKICNYETPERFRRLDFDVLNSTVEGDTRFRYDTVVTFKIVPNEGYKLPLYVQASGFEDFSYDSSTGACTGKVVGNKVKISSRALPNTNDFVIKKDSFINAHELSGYIQEYNFNKESKHLKVTNKDYKGNLVSLYEYDYDQNNVKVKESKFISSVDYTEIIKYSYNEKGLLIKEEISNNESGEYEDKTVIKYAYLENGRLESKDTYNAGEEQWIFSQQHTYEESNLDNIPIVLEVVETLTRVANEEPYLIDKIQYETWYNYPFANISSKEVTTTVYKIEGQEISEDYSYSDWYYLVNGRVAQHHDYDFETYDSYNDYGDVTDLIHYTIERSYHPVYGSSTSTYIDNEEKYTYDAYGLVSSYVCNIDKRNLLTKDNYLTGTFVHDQNNLLVEAKYTHYQYGQVLTRNIEYEQVSSTDFVPDEMKRGICTGNYNELIHKPVMDFVIN